MVPLFVVIGVVSYGLRQVVGAPTPQASLKIALIQPSIPQTMIWDPRAAADRFEQLIQLSEKALTNKPDLLVWPEAAVPGIFRWDTNEVYHGQTIYEATTSLARRHKVWLIMGADDAELNAQTPDQVNYFNSSFLINPEGEVLDRYRKQRLVIFGEYVPLSRWLPFLKDFTQVYGEFTPGKEPLTFHLPELKVKTAVLICFEDVFPHLARKHVEPDTDFLLNLTNNGWFGESAAQWQHAASAVFRAVENGLPLVRAANNGLSCWVDAQGRLHNVYFADSKNVYKVGYKIVQVPLSSNQARPVTFYTRYGDWFGWSCVALGALKVAWLLAYSRSRTR
jgi:apolipoprotein N-acyltransferase